MRVNKIEKTAHILQSIVSLLLAVPFLIFLIMSLTIKYPPQDSLVYEECTFIKYEYVKEEHRKSASQEYYHIYVEDYSAPLEIDNIVFDKIRKKSLSTLEKGDKITISKDFSDNTLYSMSHNDDYIMSYDTYLEVHKENDKLGILVWCVGICIGIGLFTAEVIYYKKTRRALPWPRI